MCVVLWCVQSCVCSPVCVTFHYTKGACSHHTEWILQPAAVPANTSRACFHGITNALLLSEQQCPFVRLGDGDSASPAAACVSLLGSRCAYRGFSPHISAPRYTGEGRRSGLPLAVKKPLKALLRGDSAHPGGSPGGSMLGKGGLGPRGNASASPHPERRACPSHPPEGRKLGPVRCPGCCSRACRGRGQGGQGRPAEGARSGNFPSRWLTWVRTAAQPGKTLPANSWSILRAPGSDGHGSDPPGPSLPDLQSDVHTGSTPSHRGGN